jgi:hypothetical protein
LDGSKQSKKDRCWSDYKAQTLYIDAMKEAMDDEQFDPRRNSHLKSAKSGQYKTNRRGAFIPKNPLTVMFLCHAYDVPYATFKRWKAGEFDSTPFVPANKGKSVIINKTWASQIYNPKRMYLDTQMAVWLSQLATRKHDVEGKKVAMTTQFTCIFSIVAVNAIPACFFMFQKHKQILKNKWNTLTEEEKAPYEKKSRDHMARQSVISESIVDALKKQTGGNCSRSFGSVQKVVIICMPCLYPCSYAIVCYCHYLGNRRMVRKNSNHQMVEVPT